MSPQSQPVAYTLQIISADDLPLRRFKMFREPRRNVFVKGTVDDSSVQTKVRMSSSSPEWKETFQIEARETSGLALQLFDSALRSTSLICASEIKISELLQLCRYGKAATMDLQDIQSRPKGHIKIHLSLSRSASWSDDEAQHLALVLERQQNTAMAAMGGRIDAVDGLLAIDFPTPPAMAAQSIQNVISKLENFMRIADAVAEIHPYAQGAVVVLSAVYKIIVAQLAIDQSVADLFQTMQDVYSFVDAIEAVPSKIKLLEKTIERILIQTAECGRLIQEYSGHGFAGRCLRETMGASTPDKVAAMAQNLTTLRGQFDTGVAINTAVVCFRIQTDVTTLVENETLDRLGSSGVGLSCLSPCHPGTRCDVVHEILEWASNPSKGDNSNVFCLHGVAGIGKSAVAATIATRFEEMGRLGAFVDFDRASPEQSQPSTAVQSIARQLAEHDGRFRASIVEIIKDRTKALVLRAPLSKQFDMLIVKPLSSITTLPGEGPIVIVLDGLYRCGQSDDWARLLALIVGQTESLPSNLRFIITSRTVNGTNTVLHPRIKSRELRSSSHSDISAYFTFRMQQIRLKNEDLQEDWPGPIAIAELTARTFGFFPWAVNASNFVDAYCPPEQMKSLLLQPLRSISEPSPPLDELYRAALKSAGDWTDAHFVQDFRAIMGAIIASPIAISTAAINHLLDYPLSQPVMVPIRRLGSVLTHEPVVRVLHPSFLYFLSSRERCGCDDWYFGDEPARVSAEPATLYLERMNTGLKGNICNMTLSARGHPTTEVLPEEELTYACQVWVENICTSARFESWEMETLVVFLHTHLLRWFEAMSILEKSEEIVPMLQRVATWLEEHFEAKSLENLVLEAIDFAGKFAADIAEHPLYVYYMALPLCSPHSMLYRLFHGALVSLSVRLVPLHGPAGIGAEPATLCFRIMNAGLRRNTCNMILSARRTTEVLPEVLAYACQSWVDHICIDGTLGPWAMEKLVVFLRTHLLHWFEAMSILKKSEEIAPMLQRVATWLEENTFEAQSLKDLVVEAIDFARKFAAEIAEHPLYVYYTALPFLPSHSMLYELFHDSLVNPSVMLVSPQNEGIICMAFSTDGLRLVTGYVVLTVWDRATGEQLVKMAKMDGVDHSKSVVFSSDGSRIACGTDESTVYVWDSVSGARVIGPLSHSGYREFVNALAWSADGESLLSGCQIGEVILWNITVLKGNLPITKIHHPGCSVHKRLRSVAFSSDGSQFASCSDQGDVYVWDSTTGGIVWSVQDPQGYDPSVSLSFLSSDMGAFLIAKTKEGIQARDASTGDLCPLPDSLAGAVGLTRGDFTVKLLMESIKKHYPGTGWMPSFQWVAQGEYFAFAEEWGQCHVVHLPKLLL